MKKRISYICFYHATLPKFRSKWAEMFTCFDLANIKSITVCFFSILTYLPYRNQITLHLKRTIPVLVCLSFVKRTMAAGAFPSSCFYAHFQFARCGDIQPQYTLTAHDGFVFLLRLSNFIFQRGKFPWQHKNPEWYVEEN